MESTAKHKRGRRILSLLGWCACFSYLAATSLILVLHFAGTILVSDFGGFTNIQHPGESTVNLPQFALVEFQGVILSNETNPPSQLEMNYWFLNSFAWTDFEEEEEVPSAGFLYRQAGATLALPGLLEDLLSTMDQSGLVQCDEILSYPSGEPGKPCYAYTNPLLLEAMGGLSPYDPLPALSLGTPPVLFFSVVTMVLALALGLFELGKRTCAPEEYEDASTSGAKREKQARRNVIRLLLASLIFVAHLISCATVTSLARRLIQYIDNLNIGAGAHFGSQFLLIVWLAFGISCLGGLSLLTKRHLVMKWDSQGLLYPSGVEEQEEEDVGADRMHELGAMRREPPGYDASQEEGLPKYASRESLVATPNALPGYEREVEETRAQET